MSDVTSRAWFRWTPGMRTACGLRVYAISAGGIPLGIRENDRRARPEVCALPHDAQPAPDDPATLGCLTQRARELWGDPNLYARPRMYGPGWIVLLDVEPLTFEGDTELAALAAACDAAPVSTKETL